MRFMAAPYVQAVVVVGWVVALATWAVATLQRAAAGGEPTPAPGALVLAGKLPVDGEEP